MDDVVVGLLVVAGGCVVGAAGYRALRLVITLLGALAGFGIGAELALAVPLDGLAGGVLTWIGGLAGAALFGWLAYAFYRVAVLLGLASFGFAIGSGLMLALGFRGGWLTWLIGALAAAVLVLIGLIGDLPAVLLIVLTSLAGANLTVTGAMLLTGSVSLSQLKAPGGEAMSTSWWWAVVSIAVAVLFSGYQLRALNRSRASAMRAQWAAR
ncbi:DUF4203 domain-containing protein [Micropruina sp.]|uniref:DUF4203 domain-containing protein n=1 Tax=Micropruina sp. TaxID=2737536 RepID=UPI0039E2FDCD